MQVTHATRRLVLRGASYTSGFVGLQMLAQVAYTAVVARLLAPEDFGHYAIVFSLAQLVTYFVGSGAAQVVMQSRAEPVHAALAALRITLLPGLLGAAFIAGCALVYGEIVGSAEALGIGFVLAAFPLVAAQSQVAAAALRRMDRFVRASAVELSGACIGYVAAVLSAMSGIGAVSLAIGTLAIPLTAGALTWPLLRRIEPTARSTGLEDPAMRRSLRSVGVQNLAHYLIYSSPLWLISAAGGAAPAGAFSRAQNLMSLPVTLLSQVHSKVLYPRIAQASPDSTQLARAIDSLLILAPVAGGVAFGALGGAAEPIVSLLLGSQWSAAVGILEILAAAGFLALIYTVTSSTIEARRGYRAIWLNIACLAGGLAVSVIVGSALNAPSLSAEKLLAAAVVVSYACAVSSALRGVRRTVATTKPPVAGLASGLLLLALVWTATFWGGVLARSMGFGLVGEVALSAVMAAAASAIGVGLCALAFRSVRLQVRRFKDLVR